MQWKPTIRKELASVHKYGSDIARGPYVFVAYDRGKPIVIAATAGEARKLYSKVWSDLMMARNWSGE